MLNTPDITIDLLDFDIENFLKQDKNMGGQKGPIGSIVMYNRTSEENLQIDANLEPLFFDEAIDLLKDSCKKIELSKLTSIRYHANTWGFSSTNWFADNIIK